MTQIKIEATEIILYVENQAKSRDFYSKLFGLEPVLDVPGMTEFLLSSNLKLGLMPNEGINTILKDKMPHPKLGTGIPRCELYLLVENIETVFEQALKTDAILISPILDRDWGDKVCYFSDLDGHVIAFAEKIK
ncbi:MAG: VOC family protein [Bacteroidota bacterium]